MELGERLAARGDFIQAVYADLHQNPELASAEVRTTACIRAILADHGLEILELGLETGVVACLTGGRPGPVIGLRADIDALPVTESEGHALRSQVEGRMHACGHDVHTAALLGAATVLAGLRAEIAGSVVFLFQPAEEMVRGARQIIAAGLFDRIRMDALFGLHVWPLLGTGYVGVRAGPVMAAKAGFSVAIQGRGGHGSTPQETADPIVAGAAVVSALQSIVSRNTDPREQAVVSVCSVHAEGSDNVIPACLELRGSIRVSSDTVGEMVKRRLTALCQSVAEGYGCSARVTFSHSVGVTANAARLLPLARACAAAVVGEDHVVEQEFSMASEDFSEYARHVPTFFYFLGSDNPGGEYFPLHHSGFRADSGAPARGAALLATTALKALQESW